MAISDTASPETENAAGTSRGSYTYKGSPYSSHSRMMEAVPAGGKGSVVDVGGGEGYLSRLLVERGHKVVCLAQPGSIDEGLRDLVQVLEVDLNHQRPRLPGPFSIALCGDVLEHLVDPEATLQWLRQSLDSGGRLIASLPNSAHWYVRLNFLLGRIPEEDRGLFDRTHLHFYAWRNWESLLQRAGFVVEQVTPTVIPFDIVLPRLAGGRIVRALEGTTFLPARLCGSFWAFQFVVVARPR
jgi:SAM-dependent methyltransferase